MKKVKIGEQVWTKRNLKVSHYRNGDIIPEVKDPDEWKNLKTGAWCYFKNKKKKKHGKLYNWYAVNDPRGLAPEGWHIPTKGEFETLMSTVKYDDNSLKAEGIGKKKGVGTNKSEFSALLSGYRSYNGYFEGLGYYTSYWSSTEYDNVNACSLELYFRYNSASIYKFSKKTGFNVRLIKDKK